MPHGSQEQSDSLQQPDAKPRKAKTDKLSRNVKSETYQRATTGELVTRVAPLGAMLGVRARIARALEGEGPN